MAVPDRLLLRYKRRLRRLRLLWRADRKSKELSLVSRKTQALRRDDIVLFATMRNEMRRLPFFLDHYRKLGVGHFLIVDNDSEDGTLAYLGAQPDVSVWHTQASYKAARFGMDWLTCLQWRYGHGRWIVTVDADELLIYPDWPLQDLRDLTRALDAKGIRAMQALMLDFYPKGHIEDQTYTPGQDPLQVLQWFDAYGYWAQRQAKLGNLWLQGGPRARYFYASEPERAPTLNKIPLIRWDRAFVYVNSTHNALPAYLNHRQAKKGCGGPTGILLHTKFLPDAPARAGIEKARGEHFADGASYADYYDRLHANPDLWCSDASYRYEGPEQLLRLGLMTRGADPENH